MNVNRKSYAFVVAEREANQAVYKIRTAVTMRIAAEDSKRSRIAADHETEQSV